MKNICLLALLMVLYTFQNSQAQLNLTLAGQLDYPENVNDVWAYVSGSNEYAIIGTQTAVAIIDVTVPTSPTQLHYIPGVSSSWRDVKVWGTNAYVINETSGGLMIIDLSGLPSTINTTYTDLGINYTDSHNIFIDENGIGYLFGASSGNPYPDETIIIDIATDPANPTYLGSYTTEYVHDGFARGDTLWTSEIYAGRFAAIDVTNKATPIIMATHPTPFAFTHNCWLSDDGNTLYTTDERSNAVIPAYDVSDLNDIRELDRYQTNPGTNVIPHNTFVLGDFLVTSYYTAGVTVVDATYPYNLIEVGYYDTSPSMGGGFDGCWGTYPYLPSGTLLATDRQMGLFVLNTNYTKACYLEGDVTDANTGLPIAGATIDIQSGFPTPSLTTGISGFFATGTPTPGMYTVTVSAPGYISQTVTVSLVNGVLVYEPFELISSLCGTPITGVSAMNVTTTTADISWVGDPNALNYTIQYQIVGSGNWQTVTTTNASYQLTGLIPGESYELQIESDCGGGAISPINSTTNFVTLQACLVPSNIMVNNVSSTSAVVTWNPEPNATSYVLTYNAIGSGLWNSVTVNSNSTVLTGLDPNTMYEFVIETFCDLFSESSSGDSPDGDFTTTILCNPPNGLTVNNITDTAADITWANDVNATAYELFYRPTGGNWMSIVVFTNAYQLTGLSPETTYEFYIQSDCGGIGSMPTVPNDFETTYTCLAPNNLIIGDIGIDNATLSWEAGGFSTNNFSITVEYRPVGTTTWLSTGSGLSNQILLNDLIPCTEYEYQITTECDNGFSVNGGLASFSTAIPVADWTPISLTNCVAPFNLNTTITGDLGGVWSGGNYISNTGSFDPRGLTSGDYAVTYTVGVGTDCENAQTYNITITTCSIGISMKFLLEGPYDDATGEMRHTLNDLGLLPTDQPYNTAPWNYAGTESITTFPSNTVDWVLVELRSSTDTTTIIESQAALLLSDGSVVDVNSNNLVNFTNLNVNEQYFLVVRHRNHLDVISATAIDPLNTTIYDFSTSSGQALGTNQLKNINNTYVLHAGECTGDGLITVDDFNTYSSESSKINEYKSGDINLDRVVTVQDFNTYLPNASIIGIPYIRY